MRVNKHQNCFKNILFEQVYWYKQTKHVKPALFTSVESDSGLISSLLQLLWPDMRPANILRQNPQKKPTQEQIWPQGMLYSVELNRSPSQLR